MLPSLVSIDKSNVGESRQRVMLDVTHLPRFLQGRHVQKSKDIARSCGLEGHFVCHNRRHHFTLEALNRWDSILAVAAVSHKVKCVPKAKARASSDETRFPVQVGSRSMDGAILRCPQADGRAGLMSHLQL